MLTHFETLLTFLPVQVAHTSPKSSGVTHIVSSTFKSSVLQAEGDRYLNLRPDLYSWFHNCIRPSLKRRKVQLAMFFEVTVLRKEIILGSI